MFITTVFTVAKMSFNRGLDKEDEVHIYTMQHYSAIRKYEILPFATTWMDLDSIMQNNISQKKPRTI